ncbi:hypothetical protein EDC04DRAFT_2556118 [Pisolithus marmoratus]|nr:hypothetical protein EDC04DRAFT_2556118 [Pisolithus marmoratus]
MVATSNIQNLILNEYPTPFFSVLEGLLSFLALGPVPCFIPLVLLVSVLRIHGQRIAYRQSRGRELFCSWIGITVGSSIAHRHATSAALSSPVQSLAVIVILSSITYLFAIATIYLDVRLGGKWKSGSFWSQVTLFPFLWTTTWSIVSHFSPVGRLLNWSPASTSHSYNWVTPFMGPAAVDWLVAAWASLLSEMVALWLMGFDNDELIDTSNSSYISERGSALLSLGTLLLALTLPSFTYNLPLRTDVYTQATSLKVGCVLPHPLDHRRPSLDDYVQETSRMTSAKVLLWPESAVTFSSVTERESAFERIRKQSNGAYVGVAFEQYVEDHTAPSSSSRTMNGLAIIHHKQKHGEEVIQYYKRQLVPLTESFSKIPSVDPPKIQHLELTHPKGVTAPQWAPAPNFTRSVPFTTSICLDFASPTAFTSLNSRPALILGPGRTWDTTVGLAMWEQAKTRAAELGSMVLWCDGGDTGVSGIGGQGIEEIMQVGAGSWERTIGIPWPFDERRTVYATMGEFFVLVILAAAMGSNVAVHYLGITIGNRANVVLKSGRFLLDRILPFRRALTTSSTDGHRAEENTEHQHLLG